MKINEQKLDDTCVSHGWCRDTGRATIDIRGSGATVVLIASGRQLYFKDVSGPFGAVNDILRGIESCIEEG